MRIGPDTAGGTDVASLRLTQIQEGAFIAGYRAIMDANLGRAYGQSRSKSLGKTATPPSYGSTTIGLRVESYDGYRRLQF